MRGNIPPAVRELALNSALGKQAKVQRNTTSATTAPVLTCKWPTGYSSLSNGCTARMSFRARASDWRRSDGLSSATEAVFGLTAPWDKARPFILHSARRQTSDVLTPDCSLPLPGFGLVTITGTRAGVLVIVILVFVVIV